MNLEPSLDQGVAFDLSPPNSLRAVFEDSANGDTLSLASAPLTRAYISPNQCQHVCEAESSPPPPADTHYRVVLIIVALHISTLAPCALWACAPC